MKSTMWAVVFQLVCTAFILQVTTCYTSCSFHGHIANCARQWHRLVPVLPPSIRHLYLEGNHIGEINSTSLRAYEELQELDLGDQKVPLVIRNYSFLRQRKLTRLVLGSNLNLNLEPRAFAGLSNLQQLFLDYCTLTESILEENYLEPLLSLEMLDLFGNTVKRLRPGRFFSNLTKFSKLNLKLNQIERLCEEDLVGFRGKYFTLDIQDNSLFKTDFQWGSCGNPFKGVGFRLLDISSNGLNLTKISEFFRAINGTLLTQLVYSGYTGKGFSHSNFLDPDDTTFKGLENSLLTILQLPKNQIFALHNDVFSPLKHVVIIDLFKNKVNQIHRNAFRGVEGHLKMLNLSSNLLGEIRSDTFNNLVELVILDLSYNHIGVLGYRAFSGLSKLQNLNLKGNSLRDLGFPEVLPSLNILFLGDNKLNSVTQISHVSPNSVYVDISDNRLTNLEDIYVLLTHLKHLQYLFYGGNFVRYCTINQVTIPGNNNLQELDLHGISLQLVWSQGGCLDMFDNLKDMKLLNVSLNSLMTLPQGIFSGLSSIIEIDLSSNALTYLQADVFPVSLKILHLSNNFLASPDPATFRSLSFLSLSENRFHCDCTLESFLNWLNMTNVTFLSPVKEYRCEFPAAVHNLPLLEYATIIEPCEGDDEEAVQAYKWTLFIISVTLIIIVLLGGIIYTRQRGRVFIIYKRIINRVLGGPKPAPAEQNWRYDTFLCFSNSDYKWVEDALLQNLDNQFSEDNLLRCCFEARDFLPGEDHLSNIRDAIWCSRKTLCVVSKEFLKDGWCLEALTLAHSRMLEDLTNVLIVLVVGKVARYQLMKCHAVRAFVQGREYLTWPEDPQDLEWFFERLISQILKDTKVKTFEANRPEFAEHKNKPGKKDKIPLENIRVITT